MVGRFISPTIINNVEPARVEIGKFNQYNKKHKEIAFQRIWTFQNSPNGYYMNEYKLVDERELRGRWHRIEVQARWAKNTTGFFRVWVNGVRKVNYRGNTIDNRSEIQNNVYFLYGIERSGLSRYKNRYNTKVVPAQKVYFANVKRGRSRSALRPN